jgi:hypothetical protein
MEKYPRALAQVSTLSRRPTIGQKSASWIGITCFLWGPYSNRPFVDIRSTYPKLIARIERGVSLLELSGTLNINWHSTHMVPIFRA